MKSPLLRMTCIAAFAFASIGVLAEVAAAEQPTSEFVAAALRQQEIAAGASLDVEYTIGTSDNAVGKVGTGRRSIHYIRTPDVRFVVDKAELYNGAATPDLVLTTKTSYSRSTGECRILTIHANENDKGEGRISQGATPGPFGKVEYVETTNYWMMVTPLIDGVTHGTVSEHPEDIDGHPCWKITVPGEAIGMTSRNTVCVWVDGTIGMCPRQIDSLYNYSSKVANVRVRFQEYEQVAAGVWFPKRMTLTVDNANQAPGVSCMTVQRVSVGRVVPEAETKVDFPTGTRVWVPGKDAVYTVP